MKFTFILLLLIILSACAGQSGERDAHGLVGVWDLLREESIWDEGSRHSFEFESGSTVFEFLSDGTGRIIFDGAADAAQHFTWEAASEDSIKLNHGDGDVVFGFTINAGVLMITYQDGNFTQIHELHRKGNVQ
ncbi:MAG: hypothetical protein FWB88_09395 [Defluviitaleaceae bacterium]|nr:hypothetical protein [Defluviitaleaceae bacterium]MCL2240002.1 hypothetical protein [Defluviitaleaceae bacterium]